jgi:hypothetical protein
MTLYVQYSNGTVGPLQFTADLPSELRGKVCLCGGEDFFSAKQPAPDWSTTLKVCSACKKQKHWDLYECGLCESFFLFDFRHPAFDIHEPFCWNCLEAHKTNDVAPGPEAVKRNRIKVGKIPPPSCFFRVRPTTNVEIPVVEKVVTEKILDKKDEFDFGTDLFSFKLDL